MSIKQMLNKNAWVGESEQFCQLNCDFNRLKGLLFLCFSADFNPSSFFA